MRPITGSRRNVLLLPSRDTRESTRTPKLRVAEMDMGVEAAPMIAAASNLALMRVGRRRQGLPKLRASVRSHGGTWRWIGMIRSLCSST